MVAKRMTNEIKYDKVVFRCSALSYHPCRTIFELGGGGAARTDSSTEGPVGGFVGLGRIDLR